MKVYKIDPLGFASNCYLITEDGVNAIAIDPGQSRVLERTAQLGLNVKYVLLTHGHFDHIGGVAVLQNAGAKVGCLSGEDELAMHNHLGGMFGRVVPPFTVDFTFYDGENLQLCGIQLSVLSTPWSHFRQLLLSRFR